MSIWGARAASELIRRQPNATTVAAAMARGAAGDACAQQAEEGDYSYKRCAMFMVWSTGVAFVVDRYIYSHLFAKWFPRTSMKNVWKATLADNAVVTPFLYFPAFYLWQGFCDGASPTDSMDKYGNDAVAQLPMTWAFWVPANLVTFSIAPHLRTVWSGAAGTVYIALLSYVTKALEEDTLMSWRGRT
jgi:hypothetical protein